MIDIKKLQKNIIHSQIFFTNAQKQLEVISPDKNKHYTKKAIYHGIKMINIDQEETNTLEKAETQFQLISHIKSLIGSLTPSEFMQLFPIKKDYDSHKWGTKDYFYTRGYIEKLDPNISIDEQEDPLMFLWEYVNDDIESFNIRSMLALSKLRQFMGHPSLGEEWADMNGIETHTMHQDQKGNNFLIDKQGKVLKAAKQRPRHLRLVK